MATKKAIKSSAAPNEVKSRPYFYKDSKGRWHWRITAKNGRKIAGSFEGDGFRRVGDAVTNYLATKTAILSSTTGFDHKGLPIFLHL